MDMKSACLNGVLEEEIYIEQPQGFRVKGCENHVYKLHKAFYGFKQALRTWYRKIDSYLLLQGFKRNENKVTLYVKGIDPKSQLLITLYVDDFIDYWQQYSNVKGI